MALPKKSLPFSRSRQSARLFTTKPAVSAGGYITVRRVAKQRRKTAQQDACQSQVPSSAVSQEEDNGVALGIHRAVKHNADGLGHTVYPEGLQDTCTGHTLQRCKQ